MHDSLKISLSVMRRKLALLSVTQETESFRQMAARLRPLPGGYRRIYFYHIPKAAGSSVLLAFLQMAGGEQFDGRTLVKQLRANSNGRLRLGDRGFVCFNHPLLEAGDYFFGYSHFPSHALQLPRDTFTLSCLRDPLARIISLYRMNEDIFAANTSGGIATDLRRWWGCQTSWLGAGSRRPDGLLDFAQRLPRRFLLNQIYMFSQNLDSSEAIQGALDCHHLMHLEEFDAGMEVLGKKLDLKLPQAHTNRSVAQPELREPDLMAVRELLAPEYHMVSTLRGEGAISAHSLQPDAPLPDPSLASTGQ